MKKILTFVLAFAVTTTAMGQGRLGGFLNKAKEAVSSEVKSDNKGNNFTGGNAIHVSSLTGSNRNDGSKAKPYKNLQKAIDNAQPGDVILVG